MTQKDTQSFNLLSVKVQFLDLKTGDGVLQGAQTAQWYSDYSTSNQEIFQFPKEVWYVSCPKQPEQLLAKSAFVQWCQK